MAIIGILVAISIPVFASNIQKSREAVCLNNRSVVKSEMLYAISIDEMSAKDAFEKYEADVDCPSKGKIAYYYDENTKELNVYCSVHPDSGSGTTGSTSNALDLTKRASAYAVDNFTSLESSKKPSVTKDLQSSSGTVALSSEELQKANEISPNKDFSAYFWTPTYSSSGEVMMVATEQAGKSNPLGSLIYYNNDYYYWYVNKNQKIGTVYIPDNGFDETKLDPNVTTPTSGDTWVKIQ